MIKESINRKLRQCVFMLFFLLFFVSTGHSETYTLGPIKVYEILLKPQEYYFSPFNDGKIWLNNGILQEFDPGSGKITNLNSLLGDFAAAYDYIIKDIPDSNLFFMTNSKGLLVYDKTRNTSQKYLKTTYFNSANIFVLIPEKESIWIGTSNGLYLINRADWNIARIEKTKEMSIPKITVSGQDEIYLYNQKSGEWYQYRAGTGELQKIPPPSLPDPEAEQKALIKSLVKPHRPYNEIRQLADDTDMIWFINEVGLGRLEKKNNKITYLHLGWSYQDFLISKMLVDKSNIWLFFDRDLVSLDKASAATLLIDEVTIEARLKTLDDLDKNLMIEFNTIVFFQKLVNLVELYNSYFKVKSIGRKRAYDEICAHILGFPEASIPLMENYLQSPEANRTIIPYILYGLSCAYTQIFNPEKVLHYYEILKSQYPDSGISQDFDLQYPEDIQALKKTVEDLKRSQNRDLMPDQKLWMTGKAYLNMVLLYWNNVPGGPAIEYPFSFFDKILKQYPNSTYADNAWWEMHFGWVFCNDGPDMYCLNSTLATYKKFLSLYPTSELIPRTKLLMSKEIIASIEFSENDPHATDEVRVPLNQRREYLETARKMCNEAIQAGLKVDYKTFKYRTIDLPTETLAKIEKYLQKYTLK